MNAVNLDGKSMETIDEIITRACAAAQDDGSSLEAAVREAGSVRLDAERAERLYTRVLEEVRGMNRPDATTLEREAARARIIGDVRTLVTEVSRPVPARRDSTGICLVGRNGFEPRLVSPQPSFYGVTVPMTEGYCDVTQLDPWAENHRVILYVQEFDEKNGRKPDPDELLGILTGDTVLGLAHEVDPFGLRPLAESIARKGVERPPILTYEGIPCDGNRRIAASRLVLKNKRFTEEQKERARWIRVWRAPEGMTKDQLEAIVVAMNFEEELKRPWPEYVKARIVADAVETRAQIEKVFEGTSHWKKIQGEVAKKYAIEPAEVDRYIRMVQLADDFIDYHVERGQPKAGVQHRTNENFQWFYELGAGRKGQKITEQFESDQHLRAMVYDMMFDGTIESGAQVRALYVIANDPVGYKQLVDAHQQREVDPNEARERVRDAVIDARTRVRARKAIGLDQHLKGISGRLEETPPSAWKDFDTAQLKSLFATFHRVAGAIRGELEARGESPDGRGTL